MKASNGHNEDKSPHYEILSPKRDAWLWGFGGGVMNVKAHTCLWVRPICEDKASSQMVFHCPKSYLCGHVDTHRTDKKSKISNFVRQTLMAENTCVHWTVTAANASALYKWHTQTNIPQASSVNWYSRTVYLKAVIWKEPKDQSRHVHTPSLLCCRFWLWAFVSCYNPSWVMGI